MRKQGLPAYDHYKMFINRNYNNASQKRLAKFTLIKYRINFRNYGIMDRDGQFCEVWEGWEREYGEGTDSEHSEIA